MTVLADVLVKRVRSGDRVSDQDALALLRSRDLLTLGSLAMEKRRRAVPEEQVTFIVDRNINYTNFCRTQCDFCAFYRPPGAGDGYLLGQEEIFAKIEETLELGGTVEGAEVTLSQAEVGVVDVAVNNERDLLLRDHASPLLHRQGAKGEKIPGPQHLQGVLVTHPWLPGDGEAEKHDPARAGHVHC